MVASRTSAVVELFLVGGERMVVPDVRGNSGLSVDAAEAADDWAGVLVVVSVMMIVVVMLFVLFWVCFLCCVFSIFLFVSWRTENCRKLRKSE